MQYELDAKQKSRFSFCLVVGLENRLLTVRARFRWQPKRAYPDLQSGVGFGLLGLTKLVVEDSLSMVGLLRLTQVYHNFGWVSKRLPPTQSTVSPPHTPDVIR